MAKKKKEVVEQVATNEIQEDIIDMMKEVSMQPEVDVPTEEIAEDVDESICDGDVVPVIEEDVVKTDIVIEDTITPLVSIDLTNEQLDKIDDFKQEDGSYDMRETTIDEIVNLSHEILQSNNSIEIDKLIEEVHKNNDCNCNSKPRMSWQQMMGYDWNGQNFEI